MKTIVLVILLLLSSSPILALELKHEQLNGKWLVVAVDDQDTKSDNEIWTFEKGSIQISIGVQKA
jgi:hypothetical protein